MPSRIMISLKLFNLFLVLVFGLSILEYTKLVHGVGDVTLKLRCMENEREALLEFKQGLVDEFGVLSTWGSEEDKKECCKWRGVKCSNRTGHIIALDLNNRDAIYFSFPPQNCLRGKVIISPLLGLQHLKHLDLSFNYFEDSRIPESIGLLTKLQHLNLKYAGFVGTIPNQVGNLTKLRFLALGSYSVSVENLEWLSHIVLLRHLDLSGVDLGKIAWFDTISKLSFLTELHLSYCGLNEAISPSVHLINSSSLSLAIIDLSHNNFVSSSVSNWLFNFSNSLVDIDFSFNPLEGPIPDAFGNIKSLENLVLSDCSFEGEIPKSFKNLSRLRTLDLSSNKLTGKLPDFFHTLAKDVENTLETLNLAANKLSGSLPDFTRFSSLTELWLFSNKLNGYFPENFGQSSSLVLLDLSLNQIMGSLPDLMSFPFLRELYVDHNRLSGRVPESIGQLSKLEIFYSSWNSMEDTISDGHFSRLSNLKWLDLSYNSLIFKFSFGWVPPFQLQVLQLANCTFGTHFPRWLQSQNNLSKLDISNASITDTVPNWFWDLSPRLKYLNFSYNQMRGTIPNLSLKLGDFPIIDLSSNHFKGPIPLFPPNTTYLHLSKNMFTGSVLVLCTVSNLSFTYLDLSDNRLSGELPYCLTRKDSLVILNLANNNFSGKIPSAIGSLNRLLALYLRNNSFTGELPSSLKNCNRLRVIDLGENNLSGKLPSWIGTNLTSLIVLSLRRNEFYGSIPLEICHLNRTQVLDLSHNSISGTIPHCFNELASLVEITNSSRQIVALRTTTNDVVGSVFYTDMFLANALVQWKGKDSEYKKTLGLLKCMDLSSNKLVGNIPKELATLEGLLSLNLSRNNLTGNIIEAIGQMKMLEILDMSRNQLSGKIPTGLASLNFLSVLDLSNNNFSGKIPSGTQLQSFDASVYAGNHELCGLPLPNKCPGDKTDLIPPSTGEDDNIQEDEDKFISQGFYVSISLGFIIGFWGFCGPLLLRRSWRYAYFMLLENITDWIYVMVAVTMATLKREIIG